MDKGHKDDGVPCWSGDPGEFESYATACKWYQRTTKEADRGLVVARLWSRLTGAARSVVKHLDPESFEGQDGLSKFLEVLRSSPLQQLPISDSFTKLERWNSLRRRDRETITELIVREEELYTELQQSLMRARRDRAEAMPLGSQSQMFERTAETPQAAPSDPPSTPSRSPMATGRRVDEPSTTTATSGQPTLKPPPPPDRPQDFFENEMRGYRLLKACRLSTHERQNVLVQTGNSTHFQSVRRALRSLYADDGERPPVRTGKVWWTAEDWDAGDWDIDPTDVAYWNEQSPISAYWNDGSSPGSMASWDYEWGDSYEAYWNADDWHEAEWHDDAGHEDDIYPDESATGPEENQLKEAYALAGEASKTLQEARDAVKRVRQSRGYYSPESMTGKGMTGKSSGKSTPGKSRGKSFKGGKSKGSFGPCFICGKPTHGYQQCPDRHAKGKFKGSKGKSKGKGKSKSFYYDYDVHANVLTVEWDELTSNGRSLSRAIIDTGATENAVGVDSLHDLVMSCGFNYTVCNEDLPKFRFGNGQRDQALSRVDLVDTALGDVSFYVLGGQGSTTPPLLGARTLRSKRAMISYDNGLFLQRSADARQVSVIQMQALRSGHVTIDLSERPVMFEGEQVFRDVVFHEMMYSNLERVNAEWQFPEQFEPAVNHILTMEVADDLTSRTKLLARRLSELQAGLRQQRDGFQDSFGMRRPEDQRLSMLQQPQGWQASAESTCQLGDLHQVRTSSPIQFQEQPDGPKTSDGPRTAPHSLGELEQVTPRR